MRTSLACLILIGCGGGEPGTSSSSGTPDPPPRSASALRGQFTAEPPVVVGQQAYVGQEAYVCYVFDVEGIEGAELGRVTWYPPGGGVLLHHASLYGAAGLPDVGEVPCDPMPELVAALGVYTPGGVPLEMPPGVAISLPRGSRRLLVVAHVMRTSTGAARPTYVDLEAALQPVQHVVNWVDIPAPVPDLEPLESATATGTCKFDSPAHVVTVWPHMHRLGSRFQGIVVRSDGRRESLLDLPTWDYERQLTYPVDVQLEAGDAVETHCYWNNPTDKIVAEGPYSTDEMCNQGLFVWPFDAARCAP